MNIRGIDGELIRDFRVFCISNGTTMKKTIVAFMEDSIKKSQVQRK